MLVGCTGKPASEASRADQGSESDRPGVAMDAYDVRSPFAGMTAPAFETQEGAGEAYALDPEAVGPPTITVFTRGGWCPYCNLQHVNPNYRERIPSELLLEAARVFVETQSESVVSNTSS